MATSTIWVDWEKLSQESDVFSFDGSERNLFIETFSKVDKLKCGDTEGLHVLAQARRFPSEVYCGQRDAGPKRRCCFAHVVENEDPSSWKGACDEIDASLVHRLSAKPRENMSVKEVLNHLRQSTSKEKHAVEALDWLDVALPKVCRQLERGQPASGTPDASLREVIDVGLVFSRVHEMKMQLRPVQLAAILLNVRAAAQHSNIMTEMKTGEGKTFVCAAEAAVLSRQHPKAGVYILTSSSDRASADWNETKAFLKECTGREPTLAAEGLKWGVTDGGSGIVYAQVTDLQRMVVDEMQRGRSRELFDWLCGCFLLVDESDHVLIEQAENMMYISTACRGFQALAPLIFLTLSYLDFCADFYSEQVQNESAIRDKSVELTKRMTDDLHDFEKAGGNSSGGTWPHLAPSVIHEEACLTRFASGFLLARFKRCGKEFVLDLTQDGGGGVPRASVTIVDMATGTESFGTRWTAEAPAVEAFQGLPVGGSDPLAFFNAIPTLTRKVACVLGTTGTLGQRACLDYYAEVYNARSVFLIPRNLRSAVYQLQPQFATDEEEWLRNILAAGEKYLKNQFGLGVSGPVLVITESIEKAEAVVEHMRKSGHAVMEQDKEGRWSAKAAGKPGAAHVFPYFRGSHAVMHKQPDAAIIVASCKGGRGLDLKLDGTCPEGCMCQHPGPTPKGSMGSVLFVILTQVLPERQDVQARGRCGRSGKAGVLQYQLLDEKKGGMTAAVDPSVRLQVQLAKSAVEKIELLSKTQRVADMLNDEFLLQTFVDWKSDYVEQWMEKLFPKGAGETAKPAVRDLVDEVVVQRWAYWRSMDEPRRKSGDSRWHFSERMGLRTVPDLASMGGTESKDSKPISDVQALEQRLVDFAAIVRLDAEHLFRLAALLFPLIPQDLHFAQVARNFLQKASAKSCEWTMLGGELWQPEWTGNAAFVLAYMCQQLGEPADRVEQARKLCLECLDKLIVNTRFQRDSSQKAKVLQMAWDAGHTYPGKVVQNSKEVRPEKAWWLVQFNEVISQLRARRKRLQQQFQKNEGFKLQHLSTAVEKDSRLARHLVMVGYDWVKTVFEYSPQGDPVLDANEGSEDFKTWTQECRERAEGLGVAPESEVGGGSGGGDTEMKAKQRSELWNRQGQDVESALNGLGAPSESTTGAGGVQQQKEVRPSVAAVEASKDSKNPIWKVWNMILDFYFSSMSKMNRSGMLYNKRQGSRSSDSQEEASTTKRALSASALAAMNVLRQLRGKELEEDFSRLKNDGSLDAELCHELQGKIDEINQKIYATSAPALQSDLRQDGQERKAVNHDGTKNDGLPSRDDVVKQANEESASKLFTEDESMSDEEKYLAAAMREAVIRNVRAGRLQQLAPLWRQFEDAVREWNQRAAQIRAAGQEVDPEEAKAVNELFKQIQRKLLEAALKHGEDLNAVLGENFATALRNYRLATENVKTISQTTETVMQTAKEAVKTAASWVWSWMSWVGQKVYDALPETAQKVVTKIIQVVKPTVHYVKRGIAAVVGSVQRLGQWLYSQMPEWMQQGIGKTFEAFRGIVAFVARMIVFALVAPLWLLQVCWDAFLYRWRSKPDIERYRKWGNSELSGNGLNLIDMVTNSGGISERRMRYRAALQRVWQAGWLAWWLDPSLQLGVDSTHEAEHMQFAQERAHGDYLREHRRNQQWWSWRISVASFVVSVLAAAAAIFTGVAAFLVFPAVISAFLSAENLLLQYMQQRIESDLTLTQEAKGDIQAWLSVFQGAAAIFSAAVFVFDVVKGVPNWASAAASGTAAAEGAAEALSAIMLVFSRFNNWVRNVLRMLGWRSSVQSVDKVLGVLGISGASLYQLGMTSIAKMCAVILGVLSSFFQAFDFLRKLLNNMLNNMRDRMRDERKEQKTGIAKAQTVQNGEVAERADGSQIGLISNKGVVSVHPGEAANDQNQKQNALRNEAGSDVVVYTPKNGEPVRAWVEKDKDGKNVLKTSRPLTGEEQELFKRVSTGEEDLKTLFKRLSSEEGAKVMEKSEETHTAELTDRGGKVLLYTLKTPQAKIIVSTKEGQVDAEITAFRDEEKTSTISVDLGEKPKIDGKPLTSGQGQRLMELSGIDQSEIKYDEDGLPVVKEWNENPDSRPEELPNAGDAGSKAWARYLQVIIYLQARKAGASPAKAKAASEGRAGLEAAAKALCSMTRRAKSAASAPDMLLHQVEGREGEERKAALSKREQELYEKWSVDEGREVAALRIMAYREALRQQKGEQKEGKEDEQAQALAESRDVVKLVHQSLSRSGAVADRSHLRPQDCESPKERSAQLQKLLVKLRKQADAGLASESERVSWATLLERIGRPLRANDPEALRQAVDEFLAQGDQPPEWLKEHPELLDDWKRLRTEQGDEIRNSLLKLVEDMQNRGSSDERVLAAEHELLTRMWNYVGNQRLEQGEEATRRSVAVDGSHGGSGDSQRPQDLRSTASFLLRAWNYVTTLGVKLWNRITKLWSGSTASDPELGSSGQSAPRRVTPELLEEMREEARQKFKGQDRLEAKLHEIDVLEALAKKYPNIYPFDRLTKQEQEHVQERLPNSNATPDFVLDVDKLDSCQVGDATTTVTLDEIRAK